MINFLYTESELSEVHLMCLNSFNDNGHECRLWVYQDVINIPDFAHIEDAREIMQFDNTISVRQLSDIFRLKLLIKQGGWWSDLDNYCISPLSLECEYVFPAFYRNTVNNNIIKAPAGSEILQSFLNSNPDKYNFESLHAHIVNEGLKGSIFPVEYFNPLRPNLTGEVSSNTYIVHLFGSVNTIERILNYLQTIKI